MTLTYQDTEKLQLCKSSLVEERQPKWWLSPSRNGDFRAINCRNCGKNEKCRSVLKALENSKSRERKVDVAMTTIVVDFCPLAIGVGSCMTMIQIVCVLLVDSAAEMH